jgi:hypothetical protein
MYIYFSLPLGGEKEEEKIKKKMGAAISRKTHPQPTLIPFYQVSLVYLIFETLVGLLWIACMFTFKFGLNAAQGAQYRQFNEASLFHFTAAITMWTVVQQTLNNNSVSWWALIPIFVAVFSDLSQLLSASVMYLTDTVPWAWRLAMAQSIIQLFGSVMAFFIYFIVFRCLKPKDLPIDAAFIDEEKYLKSKKRTLQQQEPLLSKTK